MQQMLIQKMFQAADTDGDGVVSKAEFENFYQQFMGTDSMSGSSSSATAAADRLFEQVSVAGHGLTESQFATAVKLMISQKTQGRIHPHPGVSAGAAAPEGVAASAVNNPTSWLEKLLASTNRDTAGQTASAQNSGSLEFIA
jgi:hypothetical protein